MENIKKQRNEIKMKISDINPHIRYAKTQYSHTANATEPRICYDCRIFFIEKATGTFFVNGKEYNITSKFCDGFKSIKNGIIDCFNCDGRNPVL